jgi:hypothetical protein
MDLPVDRLERREFCEADRELWIEFDMVSTTATALRRLADAIEQRVLHSIGF